MGLLVDERHGHFTKRTTIEHIDVGAIKISIRHSGHYSELRVPDLKTSVMIVLHG